MKKKKSTFAKALSSFELEFWLLLAALLIALFSMFFSFAKYRAVTAAVSSSDAPAVSSADLQEVSVTDAEPEPEPVLPSGGTYFALGDSLTRGHLSQQGMEMTGSWNVEETSSLPFCIGSAVGLKVENKGNGGQGFFSSKRFAEPAIETIMSCDFSDAGLITIAYGRNDSGRELGSVNDEPGADTICGKLKECVEYILANCGDAKVMIFGVTPNPTFSKVNTGGWNIYDLDEQYSLIAGMYGIGYADWVDCEIMQNFSEYSSDSIHPDTAETYAEMGAYMAEKVAKYYYRPY